MATPRTPNYECAPRYAGGTLLSMLPRAIPCGDNEDVLALQRLPTALTMDHFISKPRAHALREARAQYALEFDSNAQPTYLSPPAKGSSDSAVVHVKQRHTPSSSTSLVAKVCVLERMPSDVWNAYTSLVEMAMAVMTTKTTDMVFLNEVESAADVLIQRERGRAKFIPEALTVFHSSDKCAVQRLKKVAPIVNRERPTCDGTEGEAYFLTNFVSAALRLYRLVQGAGAPSRMRFDLTKWQKQCDAAFAKFVQFSKEFDLTDEEWVAQVPRSAREYAHCNNEDQVNEVVAGMRVSLLVHDRIAVGFTPVVDYFSFPLFPDISALYVISPEQEFSLADVLDIVGASFTPTLEGIAGVRSLLAQILLSLEAGQHHLRYVHYDLHSLNIRATKVRAGMPERSADAGAKWRYVRPDGRVFVIPAMDSFGHAARIIDHGRTRVDHPHFPGNDARASYVNMPGCAPSDRFDPGVDLRSLAHDIVFYTITAWIPSMLAVHDCAQSTPVQLDISPVSLQLNDLNAVLEEMTGMSEWKGWCGEGADNYGTLWPPLATAPSFFADYVRLCDTESINKEAIGIIRVAEFIAARPEDEGCCTPSDVLDMPFFDAYTADTLGAIDVADASKPLNVGAGQDTTPLGTTRGAGSAGVKTEPSPPGSTKKRRD